MREENYPCLVLTGLGDADIAPCGWWLANRACWAVIWPIMTLWLDERDQLAVSSAVLIRLALSRDASASMRVRFVPLLKVNLGVVSLFFFRIAFPRLFSLPVRLISPLTGIVFRGFFAHRANLQISKSIGDTVGGSGPIASKQKKRELLRGLIIGDRYQFRLGEVELAI